MTATIPDAIAASYARADARSRFLASERTRIAHNAEIAFLLDGPAQRSRENGLAVWINHRPQRRRARAGGK